MSESLKKLEEITVALTDRDKRLKRTVMKLNLALDICKIGVWDLDLTNNVLEWDDRMIEIFENNSTTYEEFASQIHPDDYDVVMEAVNRAIKDRTLYDIKYRINTVVGVKKIHARGRVVNSLDGTSRFIGVCVVLRETMDV